jgi:hypothetical protein
MEPRGGHAHDRIHRSSVEELEKKGPRKWIRLAERPHPRRGLEVSSMHCARGWRCRGSTSHDARVGTTAGRGPADPDRRGHVRREHRIYDGPRSTRAWAGVDSLS